MKEELELISEIYKRINISELAPRDVIKGHLRDARRMLNDLTVKLSQHDVIKSFPSQEEIDEQIDKYSFRVPYDGSNNFYDEIALKHYKAGIEWLLNKLKIKKS